jgi:hypothetical protein
MAAKRKNLTRMKFGKLTVIRYAYSKRYAYWLCRCDCGKEKNVRSSHLIRGAVKTCGCSWIENGQRTIKFAQDSNVTHGDTVCGRTRLYGIWINMKQRCKADGHKDYGGRGIRVCDAWYDYTAFKRWALENGYNDTLSIDRIDVNGNYEPENCRWANNEIQSNNTRRNVFITCFGETKTVSQWAKYLGISLSTFSRWLKQGKTIEGITGK